MTLIKPFLIGLTVFMVIVGLIFLVLFLRGKKTVDKTNEKQVKNRKLNLYLAILILSGTVIVGSYLFLIY